MANKSASLFEMPASFLLSGNDRPVCESYRFPFTVKHMLVDGPNWRTLD